MNALVPIQSVPPMTVSDVERVATAIARGGLFGSKDPNAVLTLCLLAQAEGQHPAVVFRDYHIINGKPAKKAEAMLRDFIMAGGKVEWHQLDDACADATFTHPAGSARIAWDHKRAQAAQLAGNAMYKKYPRQMLRSRVISEGIRTVFPGATSGLYEADEVRTFEPTADEPPHNPQTGEIVEHPEADERLREPAAREKLDGPHDCKTKLRAAVHGIIASVRKVESIAELDTLKAEHKRTINQALRDWPALINGDPRIEEDLGLKGELEKRREELDTTLGFQLLVSNLEECKTAAELKGLLTTQGDAIGMLDGAEARRFEEMYDAKAESLKAPTPLEAGAFGG